MEIKKHLGSFKFKTLNSKKYYISNEWFAKLKKCPYLITQDFLGDIDKKYDVYSVQKQLIINCEIKYLHNDCDGYYDIIVSDASYAKLQLGEYELDMKYSSENNTFTLPDVTIDNPLYSNWVIIKTDGKVRYKQIFLQQEVRKIYLVDLDIVCILKSLGKIIISDLHSSHIFDFDQVIFENATPYYKLLRKDLTHHGFKYTPSSLNIDPNPFNPTGECQPGGLYFFSEEQLENSSAYVNLSEVHYFAEVFLPKDAQIHHEEGKSKADKIVLGDLQEFWCDYEMCLKVCAPSI